MFKERFFGREPQFGWYSRLLGNDPNPRKGAPLTGDFSGMTERGGVVGLWGLGLHSVCFGGKRWRSRLVGRGREAGLRSPIGFQVGSGGDRGCLGVGPCPYTSGAPPLNEAKCEPASAVYGDNGGVTCAPFYEGGTRTRFPRQWRPVGSHGTTPVRGGSAEPAFIAYDCDDGVPRGL